MDLQKFDFEGLKVRVVDGEVEPLFVAPDVASILGYTNPRKAVNDHCKAPSTVTIRYDSQNRHVTAIPERDVYRLIMKSRKPEAERFEEWVVGEVLPTVRHHGGYLTPEKTEEILTDPDNIIRLAQDLKDERNRRQIAEKRNEELDEHNRELQPKAEYHDDVLSSDSLITIKTIAKELGTGPQKLNDFLHRNGVIYKEGGLWHLYYRYQNRGLAKYDTYRRIVADPETGEDIIKTRHHLKWTEKGRKMIHRMWSEPSRTAKAV